MTPYNPDASKTPPEDLGVRCYGFSVSPGQTRAFEVDNSRPGGEPRTIGYWKNWNRCTGGNQSATAQKNGGAAAGFFLVEDLLPQTIGDLSLTSCDQAVKLLAKQDASGRSRSSDAAYGLGAQLLAAGLNLGAGAERCSAVQQVVLDGQTLLDAINFTGVGDYLGSKSKDNRRTRRSRLLQPSMITTTAASVEDRGWRNHARARITHASAAAGSCWPERMTASRAWRRRAAHADAPDPLKW